MLPGVNVTTQPPAAFQKGALVAIAVPGNPAPIAVGLATMSADDMRAAGLAAGKGKAVEVLQAYGDYLYAEAAGSPVPNEGFLPTAVMPLAGAWEGDSDDDEGLEGATAGGEGGEEGGEEEAGAGRAAVGDEQAGSSSGGGDAAAAAAAEAEVDMDALLEAALLQALHKSVKDGDLPLAGSVLW